MHSKKPIIGISLGQAREVENTRFPTRHEFDYLGKAYHYAVEKTGGLPIGLFNTYDEEIVDNYLETIDALIFTGGPDIDARYFGQKPHPKSSRPAKIRDKFEIALIRSALKMKIPILCICRGHQLLNVALGGTLYQDLKLFHAPALMHASPRFVVDTRHYVNVMRDSHLYSIVKKDRIFCNSSHHQVIDKLGEGLKATAWAPDGVVEALELDDYPFLISVQWHPERIFEKTHARQLFEALIAAAGEGIK
jgi:putative glutamine amidotransferase